MVSSRDGKSLSLEWMSQLLCGYKTHMDHGPTERWPGRTLTRDILRNEQSYGQHIWSPVTSWGGVVFEDEGYSE